MTAPAWWSLEPVAPIALAASHPPAVPQRAPPPVRRAAILDAGSGSAPRYAVQADREVRTRPIGSPRPASAATPALQVASAGSFSPSPLRPASGGVTADPSPSAWPAVGVPRSEPGGFGRWSGSAWLLVRRDGGAALAPGGTLGGSQAGARLLYRLNRDAQRPLALSGRLYLPLRGAAGAEAALGLDWRPSRRLPLHLLAERRQRLGREGRSAFALAAYGGGGTGLGRGWRLEGYAQAGIVGARSRDAFVDGSARLSRAIGPVEAGAALWGAAQPGASRLDAGPQFALPIRIRGASLRLSAEYRFRIAGDARPASGPALTLGVDF